MYSKADVLQINTSKVTVFERWTSHRPQIIVDANILECVAEFVHLVTWKSENEK